MKKLIFTLFTLISLSVLFSCQNTTPKCPPTTSQYTDVIIKNSSKLDSVQVFVTLQSTESIVGKFGMDSTNFNPNSKNPDGSPVTCKGVFWAYKGIEYHLGDTATLYGAVVSFGADNYACDAAISHGWDYGINIFEFTVNTPSTGNESTDLSCLDGLNVYMMLTVSDTVNWIAGGKTFKNPAMVNYPLSANCNIPGVYPYHCDVCIDTLSPPKPVCFPFEGCSSNPVNNCQLDRATVRGGNIKCEFLGFTPVPMK